MDTPCDLYSAIMVVSNFYFQLNPVQTSNIYLCIVLQIAMYHE